MFRSESPRWIRRAQRSRLRPSSPTCITQPFLQQRLEFAHVLETEVERLETRDGRLAEIVPVEFPHGEAHVPLRKRTNQNKRRTSTEGCICVTFGS